MTLSTVFLALFLILFAINALTWVLVSAAILGIVALITGTLLLVEGFGPGFNLKR